jgi:hypothetical protein
MGFIHHTTGATGATGLMAESVHPPGSGLFRHPGLPGLPNSTALIGGHPHCPADRATVPGEAPSGQVPAESSPAPRFRPIEGQHQ